MKDFLTQPKTLTPRYHQSPAEYGSAVTRYGKSGKNRPWLNFLLAVGIGAGMALLLTWRG